MERIQTMSPDDRANLRIEDTPGINSVHYGHIQRLYGEQVGA